MVHGQSRSIARQVLNGSIRRHYRDGFAKTLAVIGEYLALIQFTNLYLGGAYIAAGEKPDPPGC